MWTYNAVLHTKPQLKLGMRPPDNSHGDRWTVDNTQLNILLTFQILKHKYKIKHMFKLQIQNNYSKSRSLKVLKTSKKVSSRTPLLSLT